MLLPLLAATTAGSVFLPPTGDYPFQSVPFQQVSIEDNFWKPRIETLLKVTIDHELEQCEKTGRLENFEAAIGVEGAKHVGYTFNDSDVYKVIEAIAFSLELKEDPELEERTDKIIEMIGRAQEPDGYLHTAKTCYQHGIKSEVAQERWASIAWDHELYNVGHMYEAAVAYYEATGKSKFLTIALKNADLVCRTFNDQGVTDPPGHEEIEIGLVKLWRLTGKKKYLDQAQWFLHQRGRHDNRKTNFGEYAQDQKPIEEQDRAVGHSVRAAYLYSAMADVSAITGRRDYQSALEKIWTNLTERKLYLTGGIGSTGSGEGFTGDYDLPNLTAYSETCAAIANIMWNQRMFQLTGDARYIDVLERSMYNAFLSGYSMEGKSFFYPNPLQSAGADRSAWFGCACCPPNIARTIATIGSYVYAQGEEDVLVNLYVQGRGSAKAGTMPVDLTQTTNYPWDGRVKIDVAPERSHKFGLRLRVPEWAQGRPLEGDLYRYENDKAAAISLKVNGHPVSVEIKNGYAVIDRKWQKGDVVELNLPMEVRRVASHPEVKANINRVALERGPLVYCAEFADQADKRVLNLMLPDNASFSVSNEKNLLNGVTVIKTTGVEAQRDMKGVPQATDKKVPLTLIPYYAWAHRGRGEMAVWLATDPSQTWANPAPTIAATSTVTTSLGSSTRLLGDQLTPLTSDDHSVPYFHWWPRKNSTEWVLFSFAKPASVSTVKVYWFQDAPHGGCRVPVAWRVLYKDGNTWVPVEAKGDYPIGKDDWNTIQFAPVNTTALRLEFDLKDFSTGIHEVVIE